MTSPIVQYIHHGRLVSVYEYLKGKHRDHCLCYSCAKFQPGCENNCPIAQKLYQFDVKHDLVTPVWECPQYAGQEQSKAEIYSCETPCSIAMNGRGEYIVCYDIPANLHISAEGHEIPEDVHEALVKDGDQPVLIFGHKGMVVHSYYPARETDNG